MNTTNKIASKDKEQILIGLHEETDTFAIMIVLNPLLIDKSRK